MAVMKMVALTMVGPHDEMEPVARQMVMSGGFQPIPIDFLGLERKLRAKVTTESSNPYDELISKMSVVWRVCGEEMPEPAPVPVEPNFKYGDTKRTVDETIGRIEEWSKRRDELSVDLDKMLAAKKFAEAMLALGMDPSDMAKTNFLKMHFGSLTPDNFERIKESTSDAPFLICELSRSDDSVWVLVFGVPGYDDGSQKIFESVLFREYPINDVSAALMRDGGMNALNSHIDHLRRSVGELEDKARGVLAERRDEFNRLYSALYTMQRVYDLCKGRGEVGGMFVLSGWIPEDVFAKLKEKIATEAPMSTIIVERVGEMAKRGIGIPTLLSNSKIVRAFQDVVAMYSVPSYGEVDPSPFVAVTFILFFGFMFGDVGHGVMLLLGSHYLNVKGILSQSLSYVMKCASLSSIVFGFLYGSVMGVEDLLPAVWISPMHDAGTLFGVAIIAGVAMISVGMILNMIVRYRDKEYGHLLFDGQGLAGLIVYWGAAAAIAVSVMGLNSPIPVSAIWSAVGIMLLVTIFRDALARAILRVESKEKVSGAMHAFEVLHNLMNYFTNTASFVRLAAFALNHVALSFAVRLISEMLADLPGGIIFKAAILVIGNVFIVCLEGLIVFIQVLRLEYYEFFSKFYKGGGSAFKPIGWHRARQYGRQTADR